MQRLFTLLLLVLLAAAGTETASADEGVDTTTVNVSFVGQTLMGTLVARYSCVRHGSSKTVDITNETWTFEGQFNGKPFSAAGKWEGTWNGKDYIGRITEITSWTTITLNEVSIGGRVIYPAGIKIGKPRKLPINTTIRSEKGYAEYAVSGLGRLPHVTLPLAVQGYEGEGGQVPGPCEGARSFSVTNVAGARYVQGLPATGAEPLWPGLAALALVVLGSGALFTARRLLRPPFAS